MRIELYKNPEQPIPVPFLNGVLQYDFANFLVVRYRSPKKIRENMSKATPETMRHIANDTRMLLENLMANGINVEDATWDEHIEPLLEQLSKNGDWKPETYNIRYTRWRDYFDYLISRGIRIKAIFPAKVTKTRTVNDEDDALNYTKSNTATYQHDEGHKTVGKKSDYTDRVISLDQFTALYDALHEYDPVYAVMAKVDMLTMLRIENLVQIPFRKSPLNKRNWMIWPEFQRAGRKKLRFNCIGKFNKTLKVDVWPAAIQTIYEDYIAPYYDERKQLFNDVYMSRSNASMNQGKVNLPKDTLWLTKTGVPVKPYMMQMAFRDVRGKLGFEVEPHFLRHTGATHLLYGYCKKQGIEPDVRLASVFHQVLKGILCHEKIETTRMYIRTILKQKASIYIPHIQEDIMNNIEPTLDPAVVAGSKKTINEFYGYLAGELPDIKDIKSKLSS